VDKQQRQIHSQPYWLSTITNIKMSASFSLNCNIHFNFTISFGCRHCIYCWSISYVCL